jgi:hypothetical protein
VSFWKILQGPIAVRHKAHSALSVNRDLVTIACDPHNGVCLHCVHAVTLPRRLCPSIALEHLRCHDTCTSQSDSVIDKRVREGRSISFVQIRPRSLHADAGKY